MSEERDIAGLWWLSTQPDERWIGALSLKVDEDAKLTVDVPKSAFKSLTEKLAAAPTIHGHDQNGCLITLLQPGWPRTQGGSVLSKTTYSAHWALLGIQLHNQDDFKVNELAFRIQHLPNWIGLTGFLKTESRSANGFSIHYELPKDESFVINNELSVEFRPGYSFNDGLHSKKLEEQIGIAFISKNGIDLSTLKQLLHALRSLLHFATLKRVYPLEIKAKKDGHGYMLNEIFHSQAIELWNSIIKEDVESDFSSDRWIFQFSDIRSRFSEFFNNWLQFIESFEEAINCYFTTVYHIPPTEVEHLCITQALEAYHGIKYASHKQRNFSGKIQELTNTYKDHLKGLVDNVVEFAETVRDNRHYYTHHNPEDLKAGRVVKGAKLIRLNEKLKLIFQMCVLTEMGIPSERFPRLRRRLASDIIEFE
jgi:ApeA N-terminal domain 1